MHAALGGVFVSHLLFNAFPTTNMQFTLSKLFAAFVTVAAVANATPAALSAAAVARPTAAVAASAAVQADVLLRRADQAVVAQVWTDANKGGQQRNIAPASLPMACVDFAIPFQDSISSLSVQDGVMCTFFRDFRCNGPSFSARNIFIANLTTPFDNEISAVSCQAA
ncbi:hypothetical protein QCA50_008662 [Cerrena zonata]|uniref:Uncharacterized protein n=1 Tax=Cerrena zonata TaxID=2478898 RepID=A0AAW0G9W4_9APHY